MLVFGIFITVCVVVYGLLVLSSRKSYPVKFGITFNQMHAQFLSLDWKQTYISILNELKPSFIRIAAMWSEVEKDKGTYDFADIDFMMDKAKESGTQVTLVVGQKAPRWPECHVPGWVDDISDKQYEESLMGYVRAVIERYRDNGGLEIWQVENEPFIKFRFGDCKRFREDLVQAEVDLVKELDPLHRVMITDSGELSWWWKAQRTGDIFGTTLYRIVRTPGGHLWAYDWLPAAYYNIRARFFGVSPENFYIAELQGEPWFTNGDARSTSIQIQEQTMNPDRLKKHLEFASHIHSPRAYLWGVEWWYWMKEKQGNDLYWSIVKDTIKSGNSDISILP